MRLGHAAPESFPLHARLKEAAEEVGFECEEVAIDNRLAHLFDQANNEALVVNGCECGSDNLFALEGVV